MRINEDIDFGVRDSYEARADEYIDILGDVEAMSQVDRQLIEDWAQSVRGCIVDAGSGPGHWTAHLQDLGVDIKGIDLVQAFIDSARLRFPQVKFQQGSIDALLIKKGELTGLLAWYSVIHIEPNRLISILREFARCVAPGGSLLIGFFEGPKIEAFNHAVTTAYFWPVVEMSRLLDESGFETVEVHTRVDIGSRPHAAIIAKRTA